MNNKKEANNQRNMSPPDFMPAILKKVDVKDSYNWFIGYLGETRGAWQELLLEFKNPLRRNVEISASVHDTHIEKSEEICETIQPVTVQNNTA